MIKMEPNIERFENENPKNGATCPICGKIFSQEMTENIFRNIFDAFGLFKGTLRCFFRKSQRLRVPLTLK